MIKYDQNKRDKTLSERGLDMARAIEVFRAGHTDQMAKRGLLLLGI